MVYRYVSDLQSNGQEFDSQSGYHQVVTTWMATAYGQVNHLGI